MILNLVSFKTSNKILKTEIKQLGTIIFHISNHIIISPLEAIWSGEWTNPYQYNDLHRIATISTYELYRAASATQTYAPCSIPIAHYYSTFPCPFSISFLNRSESILQQILTACFNTLQKSK